MSQTLRLTVMAVEELNQPRPHYRVEVRGTLKAASGLEDPTYGLLPEEVAMTVRLPTDVGSDLVVIRRAACERALALLETLTADRLDAFDHSAEAKTPSVIADA